MSSRLLSCLFAATALLSVGCDDSTGIDDDEAANVRIVNASPVVGTLGVAVNGNTQTGSSNVAFLNAGEQCVRVDAMDPQYSLQQSGGSVVIPTSSFTFTPGGRNTVVVAGTNATNLRVVTLEDPLTPALQSGRARIRVVNARATTTMNAYVTPWNQSLGTPQTINTSNTSAAATAWVEVPAGQPVAVRLTSTTSTTPIDILNVVPVSGQELIIVAADPASGTSPLQWGMTTACSRP